MLSSKSTFSNPQFTSLPLNAEAAARDSIINRGFPREGILPEYTLSAKDDLSITLNLLALAHPIHRTLAEYASFTVFNSNTEEADERLIRLLAQTSAPFHLIHQENRFSFWVTTFKNADVQPIRYEDNISYSDLDGVLARYAVDLTPERVTNVKRGRDRFSIFQEVHPLQLSIWAIEVTENVLVEHFANTVNHLHEFNLPENRAEDIATQLLGAVVLADTGALGDEVRTNRANLGLALLIEAAQAKFRQYFDRLLFTQYAEAAEAAYAILGQIRYAGFAPDMLSAIYAKAYGAKQRKDFGRYDTPLYLTRRIWEHIPVEYLPPDQRLVTDMTCGWGSFLVAGVERLSQLRDLDPKSINDHIYGNDDSEFFARLARLGLLLSTSQDTWHVDHEDALKWPWLTNKQPNVIVGNPPFFGNRKLIKELGGRYEKANGFLSVALRSLTNGGYLAMLMPQSFVAAQASPELRKDLLSSFDIIELWELPIGVFKDATSNALVIIAQKRKGPEYHHPVRLCTVQRETLNEFKRAGVFTSSRVFPDQAALTVAPDNEEYSQEQYYLDYKLILTEQKWQEIRGRCVNLEDRVIIFPGATADSNPLRKHHRSDVQAKEVYFLSGAKSVVHRPFAINYDRGTKKIYPDDFIRPRLQFREYFERQKVLFVANQNPSWGTRVKVSIDRRNYYVSDNFWVLMSKPESGFDYITNEVIAAVVSWKLSNAWIIEHLKHPKIPSRAIRTIPFPRNLSRSQCESLIEAVKALEDAAEQNREMPSEALSTIDRILKTAYEINDAVFERISLIADWQQHPLITLNPQPDTSKATWKINGVVTEIDAPSNKISLLLEGFREIQTVQIDPLMPGWLLRQGVSFRTMIPRECASKRSLEGVIWGQFSPQPYAYMSEEDLVVTMGNLLYSAPNA